MKHKDLMKLVEAMKKLDADIVEAALRSLPGLERKYYAQRARRLLSKFKRALSGKR